MDSTTEEKAAGEPAKLASRREARWEEEQRVKGERACNIPTGVPTLWAADTGTEELPLALVEETPANTGESPRPKRKETDEDRGYVDSVTGVTVTLEDLMRAWA